MYGRETIAVYNFDRVPISLNGHFSRLIFCSLAILLSAIIKTILRVVDVFDD